MSLVLWGEGVKSKIFPAPTSLNNWEKQNKKAWSSEYRSAVH